MEPTEHTLPSAAEEDFKPATPEQMDRSRADNFTHNLGRVNDAIIGMLQEGATDAELREAWNTRADLAEEFTRSLEPTSDNPNPKPRVWFDILIDKALIT